MIYYIIFIYIGCVLLHIIITMKKIGKMVEKAILKKTENAPVKPKFLSQDLNKEVTGIAKESMNKVKSQYSSAKKKAMKK